MEKLLPFDISEKYTRKAKRFWKEAGVADKIELRLGLASETLDKILNEGLSGTFLHGIH
ncbi:MAG: hypothetical protein CM1200mP30_10110 [Pseudomonadota bacterium]|nr:MAG: hypothetical protein CM1200mP30_10110 [Pseudomonadota bacterium]